MTNGDRAPAAVGALAVGAAILLRVADPRALPLPPCPTKHLTGLDCPACGGLRMTRALLHGDGRDAATQNLFLLLASPLLGGLVLRWARARRRGERGDVPPRLAYGIAGAAGAWMLLRNQRWWPLRPTGP